MRKLILTVMTAAAIGSGFMCSTLINTQAKESAPDAMTVYYTSIEIKQGETLWEIARRYAPELDLSTEEYVNCLRRMNSLKGNTIHTGRYLTVMYRADAE